MKYIYLLIILTTINNLIAQNEPEDRIIALEVKINTAKGEDKLKFLDSLCTIIHETTNEKFDSLSAFTLAMAYELNDLEIATHQTLNRVFHQNNIIGRPHEGIKIYKDYNERVGDYESESWSAFLYNDVADSYYFSGKVDSSIAFYRKAFTLAKKYDNKRTQGISLLYMSSALVDQGKFAEGSQNLQEAAKIFHAEKDTFNIISAKSSLSILYSQNSFFKEAKEERDEAIELAKKTNNNGKLAALFFNAASDELKLNNQTARINSLREAWNYGQKSPYINFYEPSFLSGLVIALAQNDSIEKAEQYLERLESNPAQNTTGRNRASYVAALKHLAFANQDHKQALKYGVESLALDKVKKSFEVIQNSEKFLSKVYEKLGNDEQAYIHHQNYTNIKDSITSVQKVRALSYYQTIYETEKRDLKIKAQESDIALLDAKNKLKNQWFLIGGILTMLFLTAIVLRNRYKRKLEKRLAIENLRNKISHDLHDDVGSILTGLAMQTEIMEMQAVGESKSKLGKISNLSRSAMSRMRDAVWAMDAGKDNWKSLIDRMNEFAIEILLPKDIQFKFEHESINSEGPIKTEIRQNLYLIFKEALTNIVKHSNGDLVIVNLEEKEKKIQLSILDNGQQEEKSYASSGIGLTSMKKRAKQINGKLEINREDGFNVTVSV